MPLFRVNGFAAVPVQIAVKVEAATPVEALEKAKQMIEKRGGLRDAIVPNSEDDACVYDGRLYEAEQYPNT